MPCVRFSVVEASISLPASAKFGLASFNHRCQRSSSHCYQSSHFRLKFFLSFSSHFSCFVPHEQYIWPVHRPQHGL